jgi:hypothetical protein
MSPSKRIQEGTWFAVPLRSGGFVPGLAARTSAKPGIILAYFFGPPLDKVPTLDQVDRLRAHAASRVLLVGDLGLIQGRWPIIGAARDWHREEWPFPFFVRKDELSRRAWRVRYSDTDAGKVVAEDPIDYGSTLERDALMGAGAAEVVLSKLAELPTSAVTN